MYVPQDRCFLFYTCTWWTCVNTVVRVCPWHRVGYILLALFLHSICPGQGLAAAVNTCHSASDCGGWKWPYPNFWKHPPLPGSAWRPGPPNPYHTTSLWSRWGTQWTATVPNPWWEACRATIVPCLTAPTCPVLAASWPSPVSVNIFVSLFASSVSFLNVSVFEVPLLALPSRYPSLFPFFIPYFSSPLSFFCLE